MACSEMATDSRPVGFLKVEEDVSIKNKCLLSWPVGSLCIRVVSVNPSCIAERQAIPENYPSLSLLFCIPFQLHRS